MKYGRLDIQIPSIEQELDAVQQNVAKNGLDLFEASRMMKGLRRLQVYYIISTNKQKKHRADSLLASFGKMKHAFKDKRYEWPEVL